MRRGRSAFVLTEIVLFAAIPVLAFVGFQTLLDTRTGTFIEDPGPSDPGWTALVDPSPIVGVVEMDGDRITGVAVVVSVGKTARGGAVILVPGELEVLSRTLSSRSPEEAVDAVGSAMKLRIPEVEVLNSDRWEELLGASSYVLNNPDPVPDVEGDVLFGVGPVEVSGDGASAFLGRTSEGTDSLASLVRRELFWSTLLDSPPEVQDDPFSRTLLAVADGPHEVVALPLERGASGGPVVGADLTEDLVRRVVAFPAGYEVGQRFRIQIEDRTGDADLDAAARTLGRMGVEVVAIANGPVFDDTLTQLVVEPGYNALETLAVVFPGVAINTATSGMPADAVVLRLGSDHTEMLARWSETPSRP